MSRPNLLLHPLRVFVPLCATLLPGLVYPSAAAESPKNIVLILADDLGWADTTLYGKTSLYETPNIERLAARGMTFSSAYASPICSPTRASIMTGQNPARHGMTAPAAHLEDVRFEAVAGTSGPPHQKCTNVRSATRLDPELPMLSKLLRGAGYSTAHFGKWHLGREPHSPLERGFDVDIPHWWGPGPKSGYLAPWRYSNPDFKEGEPGEHIEDRMAKEAVAWLKNRDRSKPFFMNYWQFSVHAPFGAKPELIEFYRKKLGDSVAGLSKVDVRERLLSSHQPATGLPQQSPTYAAMVHSLDDAVGSLLDALDEEGIADKTIIIFYSDNGGNIHCGLEETAASGQKYITPITSNHPLRGGKGGIHEGGVRVPAVVVWPGVTKPGSRSDTRIQATDLYPTILHMLNVERPKDHIIDGVDFSKALRGEALDRGPMFTHVPGHGATPHWLPPSMSVHHGDWKLIRTFHYGEDGSHKFRLYNLREDIGENQNLAADHPDKVRELDELIEDYIAEANVVVPRPNPNFDLAKFDASKIGMQPGGFKMPPGFKGNPTRKRGTRSQQTKSLARNAGVLKGWTARNAELPSKVIHFASAPRGGNRLLPTPECGRTVPLQSVFESGHRRTERGDWSGELRARTDFRSQGSVSHSKLGAVIGRNCVFLSTSKAALFICVSLWRTPSERRRSTGLKSVRSTEIPKTSNAGTSRTESVQEATKGEQRANDEIRPFCHARLGAQRPCCHSNTDQ